MFKSIMTAVQSWFRTPGKQDFWMFMMLCAIPVLLAAVLLWMNPVSALLM